MAPGLLDISGLGTLLLYTERSVKAVVILLIVHSYTFNNTQFAHAIGTQGWCQHCSQNQSYSKGFIRYQNYSLQTSTESYIYRIVINSSVMVDRNENIHWLGFCLTLYWYRFWLVSRHKSHVYHGFFRSSHAGGIINTGACNVSRHKGTDMHRAWNIGGDALSMVIRNMQINMWLQITKNNHLKSPHTYGSQCH